MQPKRVLPNCVARVVLRFPVLVLGWWKLLSWIVTGDETWIITLKNRQNVSGMASSKFSSEEADMATPLAWKVMATVFLDAEVVILTDIILHVKLVTRTCTFKHLKLCRSISGEFNLK